MVVAIPDNNIMLNFVYKYFFQISSTDLHLIAHNIITAPTRKIKLKTVS